MVKRLLTLAAACAGVAVALTADVASAQLPWRGHYVRRNGLFHVERAHWGGGVTANGASVLNTGINVFGPMVPFLVTGTVPPAGNTGGNAGATGSDRVTPQAAVGSPGTELEFAL